MKTWNALILVLTLTQAPQSFAQATEASKEKPVLKWAFSEITALPATTQKFLFTEKAQLYQRLLRSLTDYEHSTFSGSIVRIEHELKKGPLTCFPASSSAEARKTFAYLTPLYVSPSPVLVLHKNLFEKFKNKAGEVSLKKLLQAKELRPLFTEARSYGPMLDKIISEAYKRPNRETTSPFPTNVVDMISHGRGDYSIEYSVIVDNYISTSENNNVVSAAIEEIPAFHVQYLACSKTPEGLKVIEKVDRQLQLESTNPEYKKEILALTANPDDSKFNKAVIDFVRDRHRSQIVKY